MAESCSGLSGLTDNRYDGFWFQCLENLQDSPLSVSRCQSICVFDSKSNGPTAGMTQQPLLYSRLGISLSHFSGIHPIAFRSLLKHRSKG